MIKNSNKKVKKNMKKKTISLLILFFLILLISRFIFFKGLCFCTLLYFLKEIFNPLRIVFALVVSIIFFIMNSSKLSIKVIKSLLLFLIIFIVLGIVWICFLDIYDNNCVNEVRWDKPILYLYPTRDIDVNVKVDHPEFFMTTYPKYNNGWNVHVLKDGSMYDKDGKYYYALYWDEENINNVDFSTGFYVEKDDAIEFLEDKLSYIGLNDRERNEFIMYWLPKLEDNGRSLVYFELTEERDNNNRIIINPKPDSMLRISMHIKKVNRKISIKEQKLDTFVRHGFSAVEWGGTIHR